MTKNVSLKYFVIMDIESRKTWRSIIDIKKKYDSREKQVK